MRCNEHCEEGEGRYCECSLHATRRSLRTVGHWLGVALVAALALAVGWRLLGGLIAGINM